MSTAPTEATGQSHPPSPIRGSDAAGDRDERMKDVLLDAAITSILDRGFYRASSNEIARQAEVTWGAIQYYFGTREELLLAVLERGFTRFVASLDNTHLTGGTIRERLVSLAKLVWVHYGRREYVAIMQIHLNLSRDPKRAEATEEAMLRLADGLDAGWKGLMERAFGPALGEAGLDTFVFEVLRGQALGDAIAREGPEGVVSRIANDVVRANQSRLIDVLSDHIEQCIGRAAESGVSRPR